MGTLSSATDDLKNEELRCTSLDRMILSLRVQLDKSHYVASDSTSIQFRVTSAENKLHELIVRFNQTIADNTVLKENIELLRKEKSTFQSLHSRLLRDIDSKNSDITQIIQKSNSDYATKDSVQEQMQQLRSQAEKEHADFEREWTELARLIENDKRMRDFIQQREKVKQRREISRKSPRPDAIVSCASWDPVEMEKTKGRLLQLQSHFDSIRMATGLTSIDQLFLTFTDKEKRNFSLFNKTNMDMTSITLERAKIDHLKSQITERLSLSVSTAARPNGLRDKSHSVIANVEKKAEEFGVKLFILNKLTSSIRVAVQTIFEKVFPRADCLKYMDPGIEAARMTTPIGTVTETNLIAYLAGVEARVEELVMCYQAPTPQKENRGDEARKSVPIIAPKNSLAIGSSAVFQQMLHFRLPSAVEEEEGGDERRLGRSDESDSLRPLTRNELRAKTLESLQRNVERGKNKKSRT